MLSKEMIQKDKKIVIEVLREHLKATCSEISSFTRLIENEDPGNWTCGIWDELVPYFFEKVRSKS